MTLVDALGEICPRPVILAKRALRENDFITVLVDNEVATQNLSKMAKQLHYSAMVEKEAEGRYRVEISKGELTEKQIDQVAPQNMTSHVYNEAYTVVINSRHLGHGEEELGHTLVKGFIFALTEQDVLPERIIFYNTGVFLATKESDCLEDLQTLSAKGVEILFCGLCTNYYHIQDDIAVGSITNMFTIVEHLRSDNRIVKP